MPGALFVGASLEFRLRNKAGDLAVKRAPDTALPGLVSSEPGCAGLESLKEAACH